MTVTSFTGHHQPMHHPNNLSNRVHLPTELPERPMPGSIVPENTGDQPLAIIQTDLIQLPAPILIHSMAEHKLTGMLCVQTYLLALDVRLRRKTVEMISFVMNCRCFGRFKSLACYYSPLLSLVVLVDSFAKKLVFGQLLQCRDHENPPGPHSWGGCVSVSAYCLLCSMDDGSPSTILYYYDWGVQHDQNYKFEQ
jgi:hypothetical protein